MAMLVRASYTHLPPELRETILSHCTRGSLAALSLTSKGIANDAETMLYETISLHGSRQDELTSCLRTLADRHTASKKAQLVQSFALTFSESNSTIPTGVRSMRDALCNMVSLKVLSVWAPEEFDIDVEESIRSHLPSIRRVYLSNLKDFGQLLVNCHPSLEVVGLWFNSDNETENDSETELRLRQPLAQHHLQSPPPPLSSLGGQRSSSETVRGDRPKPTPVVVGIERRGHYYGDTALRTITVFDYPLASGHTVPTPVFIDFFAKNIEAHSRLYEDLLLDFSKDYELEITNSVRVVLRNLSPGSLAWAQMVAVPMLEKYPDQRGSIDERPMVQLSVIEPPKPSSRLEPLHQPFRALVAALLDQGVDELEISEYFNPLEQNEVREECDVSEEESEKMAAAFSPILREVAIAKGKGSVRFQFRLFEAECSLP